MSYTLFHFSNYVLNQTNSIDETGKIRWQLVLCLLLAWMVVYFCMWKGVKSAGKVIELHKYYASLLSFKKGKNNKNLLRRERSSHTRLQLG